MICPTPAVRERALSLPSPELPSYPYDLAALRTHAAEIRAALPGRVELYYAAKANPQPEILAALEPCADGYEVASGGELAHVAKVVPGRPLPFGGPGKTPDEVTAALELGAERLHVESEHDLRVLAELARRVAPRRRVAVLPRVNLPVPDGSLAGSSLAMGGRPAPFGMDPARAEPVIRALADGTYPQLETAGCAHPLGERTRSGRAAGGRGERGGLGHGTRCAGRGGEHRGRHERRLRRPGAPLRLGRVRRGAGPAHRGASGADAADQPGRALTAYCGWYATEVLDVKHSHGEEFAVVRGGTHHLRTPATKGHDQPCSVLPVDTWPHPWPRPAAKSGPVTRAGQLCTPKDVLARRVPVPELRAGDRVVFSLAGAYAWNISHHDFLMHPRPGFHFLDDDTQAS